jgi:hypothetical protein
VSHSGKFDEPITERKTFGLIIQKFLTRVSTNNFLKAACHSLFLFSDSPVPASDVF